jgi:hypothetical protein
MKVSFLIAGTQKGGTTALRAMLSTNPAICMEEIHFFDNDRLSLNNIPKADVSEYYSKFPVTPQTKIIGEVSPRYMYWPGVPQRVFLHAPEIKWIILLRDPVKRAYSSWNMCHQMGWDTATFEEAIELEEERCQTAAPYPRRVFSYLDRGFYSHQLKRMFMLFPRSQFYIEKSDRLKIEPQAVLEEIAEFLGVEPDFNLGNNTTYHARRYSSPIKQKTEAKLYEYYHWEIKQLESLLGWDCTDWKLKN